MQLLTDYQLAKAVANRNGDEATRWPGAPRVAKLANQPGWVGPGSRDHRLVGRLALLLVTLGARLVCYGLPPYRLAPNKADCQSDGA